MNFILSVLFITGSYFSCTQIIENFDDGDFINSPFWSGTTNDFTINSSHQLQTNSSFAGTSFLATAHHFNNLNSKEWRFWIKMAFSPSANNYTKVYLTSSNVDLSIDPDGFYLLFGETGSQDAVRLYKQIAGISTEICSSTVGEIASNFAVSVKVIRDDLGNWTLSVDPSGGENFVGVFSGFDSTNLVGTSFGLLCNYTISNAAKFYFDNFYIGQEIIDSIAPTLVSVTPVYSNQIELVFDQALNKTSAENSLNYSLNPMHEINSASLDDVHSTLVHLSLNEALINGINYTLTSNNIIDLNENMADSQSANFTYLIAETPKFGDVIINEFMCDPSPSVDLPEVEYIEIYNKSTKYFNLQNWKIGDNTSFGTISMRWLLPNEYVILCASSSLTVYPDAVSVSNFPSLNNAGDAIVLKDNNGILIDQLTYTDEWYQNDKKKTGGYSLERIKPFVPCSSQKNWRASDSKTGGTPFAVNSVFDNSLDTDLPCIISSTVLNSTTLEIQFNEGMDSTSVINAGFSIDPNLLLHSITVDSQFPTACQIQFLDTIKRSHEYAINIQGIADCSLNQANLSNHFYLPEQAIKGDLVINEILYNPLSGGCDFLELYNTSDKIIDLHGLEVARFGNDTISDPIQIEKQSIIKPNGYIYICSDTLFMVNHYPFTATSSGIQMELPPFSVDSSTIFIIYDSVIIDRVSYSDNWQFSLIENRKGKSIERIHPNENSNAPTNWHTAAESVGFATPGSKNSQSGTTTANGDFEYTNKNISPDNDGFEDLLGIHYKMEEPGMLGTFKIFDDQGRLIKTVFKNELLATEGFFAWDGISDNATKASIGVYVGCLEAFNVQTGLFVHKRKAFSVAAKF